MLIISGIVMFLAMAALGAYFYVIDEIDSNLTAELSWLPLTTMILFMIGYIHNSEADNMKLLFEPINRYSIGFATLPFLLMGELLPANYRNTLGGVASR